MQHKLFFTDFEMPEDQYRVNKPYLPNYVYEEWDDALGKACEIIAHGGVAREIVSSDGTVIDRRKIAKILRDRTADLTGRPRTR